MSIKQSIQTYLQFFYLSNQNPNSYHQVQLLHPKYKTSKTTYYFC